MSPFSPRNLIRLMRLILLCVIMLLPLMALADGKVFPPLAVRETVTIPDQRALIHWSNGVERLVIETRFTGPGSNFAWVVPLPAKPVIEKASSGLFPTLEYLFRPELVHKITRWYLVVIALLGLGYLLYTVTPEKPLNWKSLVVFLLVCASCFYAGFLIGCLLSILLAGSLLTVRGRGDSALSILLVVLFVLVLAALLLPGMARSKSRGMRDDSGSVEILERNRVGAYETVTIAGQDPLALDTWLRDNGFAVSTNVALVIADYVKRGWVFVAAKLARDQAGNQTSTIHPLSFTFPVAEPVYPMRLTGVDGGPLSVELYVFGPTRAAARNFTVKTCTRPAFPQIPSDWIRRKPKNLEVYASPLKEWVGDAAVATKLSAKLGPHQLGEDIALSWQPFSEVHIPEFSHSGARHRAANGAAGTLLVCLAFCSFGLLNAKVRWLWRARWFSFGAAILVGIVLYSAVEKVPVRFQRRHAAEGITLRARGSWRFESNSTAETVRGEISGYLQYSPDGPIREEDSPGNYTVRETEQGIEFTGYDAAGAPHLLQIVPKQTKSQ